MERIIDADKNLTPQEKQHILRKTKIPYTNIEHIAESYLAGEIQIGDHIDPFSKFGGFLWRKDSTYKHIRDPHTLRTVITREGYENLEVVTYGEVARRTPEDRLPPEHEHLLKIKEHLEQGTDPTHQIGWITRQGYRRSNQELLDGLEKRIEKEAHPFGGIIDIV